MSINAVAPLAGAWIEIQRYRYRKKWRFVAPLAGAWIEIGYAGGGESGSTVAPRTGGVD